MRGLWLSAAVLALIMTACGKDDEAAVEKPDASAQDECNMQCVDDREAAEAAGCDCSGMCHDACTAEGLDCGLPCNIDVPGYDCHYWEADIAADDDCRPYPGDDGAYEHFGSCYRCNSGQQCCYTDGRDNGSGSFDLCAPLAPPLPPGGETCAGVLPHCDCDVVPLCGCMAQSGGIEACETCVGAAISDVSSCNAEGMDMTFCQRAVDAHNDEGFDWCGILYDQATCFDRPDSFPPL